MATIDLVRMIQISGGPEDVWNLICSPESAVLLNDGVVSSVRDPTTPSGEVGEIQRITRMAPPGGTLIEQAIKVVEIEPVKRVVTVNIPDDGSRTTYLLAGDANRTMLAIRYQTSASGLVARMHRSVVTSTFDTWLERVRELIETGGAVAGPADSRG